MTNEAAERLREALLGMLNERGYIHTNLEKAEAELLPVLAAQRRATVERIRTALPDAAEGTGLAAAGSTAYNAALRDIAAILDAEADR